MWLLQVHCLDHSRSGILKPAKVCHSAFCLCIVSFTLHSPAWQCVLLLLVNGDDDDDDDDDDDNDIVSVSIKAFIDDTI